MQNESLRLTCPAEQDDRDRVREHTAAILVLVERESNGMVEIGQRLHDVRERVGRDGFQAYLKQFFPRSQTLACQLMQVALHFHSVEPEILGRFHRGALLLLSRDRSPEGARTEALELIRAVRMKSISKSFAEFLIARHGGDSGPHHDRKVLVAVRRLQSRLVESHGQLRPETLDRLAEEFASVQAQLSDTRFASAQAVAADAGGLAKPAALETQSRESRTASAGRSCVMSISNAPSAQILPRQSRTMTQPDEILPQQYEILPRQFCPSPQEPCTSESVQICEICG